MSKYTTTVRFICESYAGLTESVGFDDLDRVIDASVDKVFSWKQPKTDNEAEWAELKKHILIHFYTREICAETVGLWKLWLRRKWEGMFEYYDQLISSAKIEFDPLNGVDYTRSKGTDRETNTRTSNEAKTESESTNNGENRDMYSATPQGELKSIENGEYLTTYNYDKSSGGSETRGESSGSSAFAETVYTGEEERVKGRMNGKSPSQLLQEYRDTLLRVEEMVCKELEPLFFGLW